MTNNSWKARWVLRHFWQIWRERGKVRLSLTAACGRCVKPVGNQVRTKISCKLYLWFYLRLVSSTFIHNLYLRFIFMVYEGLCGRCVKAAVGIQIKKPKYQMNDILNNLYLLLVSVTYKFMIFA